MSPSLTDRSDPVRNLLLGLLARRLDLLSSEQFDAAVSAWQRDRTQCLSGILRARRVLAEDDVALLDALVEKFLRRFGDDPERGLQALGGLDGEYRQAVQACLATVAPAPHLVGRGWSTVLPAVPGCLATVDPSPSPDAGAPDTVYFSTNGSDTAEMANGPAAQLTGYEILGELGRGGMGVVYQARQHQPTRLVALKMILAGAHAGESGLNRFRAEADALARLQHPNIVQVYEVGEQAGQPYFSLEYCAGGSLARRLRGTPLLPAPAAEAVAVLAGAMHAAHQAHVVHRDLKPGNILLTADGVMKVTDFGLAKCLDMDSGQTQSGAILGTPSYMAPEQAGGARDIGPPADIYALGAILYEMLTGRPPFRAATPMDTVRQVLQQDPVPPRRLQPKVPRDLETVCLKCLHKEPGRRYDSAQALAEDLRRFLSGEPIRARPLGTLGKGWRWCRRRPALAALVALLVVIVASTPLLLAAGFWYQLERVAAQNEIERSAAAARLAAAEAAAARDLAETREYYGLISQVRETAATRHAGWTWSCQDALTRASTLSPAAARPAELRQELAACLAGVDVRLSAQVTVPLLRCLAFDPQRRWLAVGELHAYAWHTCRITLADARTGKALRQLSFPAALSFQVGRGTQDGVGAITFSPDGNWLAAGSRSGRLYYWDLRRPDGPPRLLTGHAQSGNGIVRLQFSADGTALFSTGDDRTIRRWDTAAERWQQTARYEAKDGPCYDAALNLAGGWMVCATKGELRFLSADRLELRRRTAPDPAPELLSLSPDGDTLAVTEGTHIQLMDVKSDKSILTLRAPGKETAHDRQVNDLVFSPDGSLLASISGDTRSVRLWDALSGRLLADWHVPPGTCHHLAFRPDGRALAVLTDAAALLYEIGGLDVVTTEAVHPLPVWGFAFHASGRALICSTAVSARHQNWGWVTWQALGSPKTPLTLLRHTMPGRYPAVPPLALSPDGRGLTHGDSGHLQTWDLCHGALGSTPPTPGLEQIYYGPTGKLWTVRGTEIERWHPHATTPDGRWSNQISSAVNGKGRIRALAVGRRWVAAAGQDGMARLLGATDAAVAKTLAPAADCSFVSAALNPAESLAAFGAENGEIFLFEVPSGKHLVRLKTHENAVTGLAFLDDRHLFSGSADRSVHLTVWDGRAARELLALRTGGAVQQIALSPDGLQLGTLLRDDRAVRLWHLDRLWDHLNRLTPSAPLPALSARDTSHIAVPEPSSRPLDNPAD